MLPSKRPLHMVIIVYVALESDIITCIIPDNLSGIPIEFYLGNIAGFWIDTSGACT